MIMNIHFFRKNSLEKLDYAKILEYFETLQNFKIYYTDDNVEIVYSDVEFSFTYRYLITRQSRVSKIYELNPIYSNINFMLEIPVMIPTFLAKEVLTVAQKICKLFELEIYESTLPDVQPFNLVDVLVLFEKTRSAYVEKNGLKDKIVYDNEKLNIVCKYQRSINNLKDYYNNEVEVHFIVPVLDEKNKISGMSYDWKLGTPAIFPPYIDYFNIEVEGEASLLVSREEFFKILGNYFIEIKSFLPDLFVLKPKKAKTVKKELRKLKKVTITNLDFKVLRLCDVIEK
ncbi:MAG: hypothetical protein PHP41_03920 [Bacilli bacterium]|nr:hypothetical protein [Bacilli bacterium]MDY0063480.1 hypothetical protein [Bacilli bacterium]